MGTPDASNNLVSISEATEAIQQTPPLQDAPRNGSQVEVCSGKCCKRGTKCSVLNASMTRYVACLRGVPSVCGTDVEAFQPFIHRVWITLWITTLICCKIGISRQTL